LIFIGLKGVTSEKTELIRSAIVRISNPAWAGRVREEFLRMRQ
jgi:hypothetical protein